MNFEILIEGEGIEEVQAIEILDGSTAREIIATLALKGGFPAEEANLFVEDEEQPLELDYVIGESSIRGKVHHIHRARHIEVTVYYQGQQKDRRFSPSVRIQRVLDWAVGSKGFAIDPIIAPEMELSQHGQTAALPKNAHIGRFVSHPHKSLLLDLIRGVIPNGGSR